MTQLTELDYESIENAVMETARGRWFLSEHKKRHGGPDTPKILDAIARLEKVVSSINSGKYAQPQMAQTPAAPFAIATIDIPGATETVAPQSDTLSDENLQFFSNDEDLFSNDTSSFLPDAIQSMDVTETQETDTSLDANEASAPQRDRFKIFKTAPTEKSDTDENLNANPTTEIPDPSMHPTPEEQDRIVVIRGVTGEDIDIPLADEFAETAETDKPIPATN